MKNCLLLLAVVAALFFGVPAHAQYIYLDTDGDGLSSTGGQGGADVLNSSKTSVDVYLITNKNRDGSDAVCANSSDPFTIISYEFTLQASGTGTVAFGTWTDNMGFGTKLTTCSGQYCTAGNSLWLAFGAAVASPPGKYKLGTLAVTVTGNPILNVTAGDPNLNAHSQTSFGSACLGVNFDNTIVLGLDFFYDSNGTEPPTDTIPTTWGKIKDLYR